MSDLAQRLKMALLSLVPSDGITIGCTAQRREADVIAHRAKSAADSEPIEVGILVMTKNRLIGWKR